MVTNNEKTFSENGEHVLIESANIIRELKYNEDGSVEYDERIINPGLAAPGSNGPDFDAPAETTATHRQPTYPRRINPKAILPAAIAVATASGITAGVFEATERIKDLFDDEDTPVVPPDTYIVKQDDSLWLIVEQNYPYIDDIGGFIEHNIENVTAADQGREKSDLRPDDVLIIDPSYEPTP